MGCWFDRSGAGPVTLLGMTMIGAVLAGSIDSRWRLYLVYGVMMGLLGYATVYGPLSINAMRWFEHRRGLAVGLVAAGESIGGTIWPQVTCPGLLLRYGRCRAGRTGPAGGLRDRPSPNRTAADRQIGRIEQHRPGLKEARFSRRGRRRLRAGGRA